MLTDDQQRAIESISQTQFGVKIKMHDKTRAIELLGRHLGMWLDRVEVSKGESGGFDGRGTEGYSRCGRRLAGGSSPGAS